MPEELLSQFPTQIPHFHASQISNLAAQIEQPGQTSALVIGAGASGQQLSNLLLQSGAEVILAGPKVPNLPRQFLGKDIYWWLYKSGSMTMRTDRPPGKWLGSPGGDVTVGEHPDQLAAHPNLRRVTTHVQGYKRGHLSFRCRKTMPEDLPWPGDKRGVVIACTGYRNQFSWLPKTLNPSRSTTGPPQNQPEKGLYFLGQPNQKRLNSSLMGGVGRDAKELVNYLVAHPAPAHDPTS